MIIKDKPLTLSSILFVIIIFILQLVLGYKLYQSKIELMQREVELVFEKAYSIHLDKRLESKKIQDQKNGITYDIFAVADSLKDIKYDDDPNLSTLLKNNFFSVLSVSFEQNISKEYPLNIEELKSLIDSLLMKYSLDVPYNLVLFNPNTKEIISQTNPYLVHTSATILSESILLNHESTREIIIYANPSTSVLYNFAWLLIVPLIFSIFLIYCLYYQLSSLSKLKELTKSKNSFFSEVSHEMIRPLSILTQALDSLRNDHNINDLIKRNRYISFAQMEIDKMAKKIDMVLSLARDDEGMFELNIQQINLVKLVYDEVDAILVVPPKEVDIDIDNQLKENPYVYADTDHLEQILSNLINNAIKYSDKYLSIIIKIYRDKKNVYLSIKDNGHGISKEDQRFIFEKYSRVDKQSKQKGYGIGLNYVKRVVAKHGGDISLISFLGKGSEFIIRLPQNEKK